MIEDIVCFEIILVYIIVSILDINNILLKSELKGRESTFSFA